MTTHTALICPIFVTLYNRNVNQLNYSYDKVEGELGGRGELGVAFLASIPYRDTGRNELQMW